MTRYDRQMRLPEWGEEGQRRVRAASVLVVGAGGLGAPVLQYLAGAGIGHIRLVDGDRVGEDNLHRQTLFRMADIDRLKVDAAAETLAALNPDTRVEPVARPLTPANAAELCKGVAAVLDCADSFAVSYILSDICREMSLPLLSASVVGTEGYAGGFCGSAPSLRAVFPDLPQRGGSCAEDGVMGPAVGVIGAMQAQMALNHVLGLAPSPLGLVTTFDALTFRSIAFRFDGAPEPDFAPSFLALEELAADDLVIDLRSAEEAPLATPGALRVAPEAVTSLKAPAGRRLVLACRTGLRSWRAAEALRNSHPNPVALMAMGDPDQQPKKDQR